MLDICQSSPLRTGPRPTGAKLALKPVHVWGVRIRLQVANKLRDLALFDLALDSKLRGCDLIALRVSDLVSSSGVKSRVNEGISSAAVTTNRWRLAPAPASFDSQLHMPPNVPLLAPTNVRNGWKADLTSFPTIEPRGGAEGDRDAESERDPKTHTNCQVAKSKAQNGPQRQTAPYEGEGHVLRLGHSKRHIAPTGRAQQAPTVSSMSDSVECRLAASEIDFSQTNVRFGSKADVLG